MAERISITKSTFWSSADPQAVATALWPKLISKSLLTHAVVETGGVYARGAMLVEHFVKSGVSSVRNAHMIQEVNISYYQQLLLLAFKDWKMITCSKTATAMFSTIKCVLSWDGDVIPVQYQGIQGWVPLWCQVKIHLSKQFTYQPSSVCFYSGNWSPRSENGFEGPHIHANGTQPQSRYIRKSFVRGKRWWNGWHGHWARYYGFKNASFCPGSPEEALTGLRKVCWGAPYRNPFLQYWPVRPCFHILYWLSFEIKSEFERSYRKSTVSIDGIAAFIIYTDVII